MIKATTNEIHKNKLRLSKGEPKIKFKHMVTLPEFRRKDRLKIILMKIICKNPKLYVVETKTRDQIKDFFIRDSKRRSI